MIHLLGVWLTVLSSTLSILTDEYSKIQPIHVPVNQDHKLNTWQPILRYENECRNYPAVDANGILSQGNAPSVCDAGVSNQAYVRLFRVHTDQIKMKAYIYTFFIPTPAYKQTSETSAAHWDSVVVFMDGSWDGFVRGVAYTSRGTWFPGFKPSSSKDEKNIYFTLNTEGLRQVERFDRGTKTELISWYWIPSAARMALEVYGFGPDMKNACPINKDNLRRNLFEAAVQTRLWPWLTFEMLENFDTAEGRGSI